MDSGLDALARAKRAADAEKTGVLKRPHYISVASDVSDDVERAEVSERDERDEQEIGSTGREQLHGTRKYRAPRPEDTPSHPGTPPFHF